MNHHLRVDLVIVSKQGVSLSSMSLLAVSATVDGLGDITEVTSISFCVKIFLIPKPCSSFKSDFGRSSEFRVVNEINSEGFTSSSVVGLTSDLDGTSSLIFNTISRSSVAQILSAFISLSGGEFLHVLELTRFVAKLSKESVLSGRSIDTSIFHSLVQIGSILVKNLGVSTGHHLLELLNRKSSSWGRGIWFRSGNWGSRFGGVNNWGCWFRGNWSHRLGSLDWSWLNWDLGLNWGDGFNWNLGLNGSWLGSLNWFGSLNWLRSLNRMGSHWSRLGYLNGSHGSGSGSWHGSWDIWGHFGHRRLNCGS